MSAITENPSILRIQIPWEYTFLSEDSDFQRIITETMLDYVEYQQDQKTIQYLEKSKKFRDANARFSQLAWKLS